MMTVLEFWKLMQNDPIKKHNEIKENEKMVLIDRDEIIEKLRKAANYHKKEVNNKTTVGIDLAMHKAQWKAFEDAILQCKHCEEKNVNVKKEDTAPFEVSTTGKYNSPMKVTIVKVNKGINFFLNDEQVSWSELIKKILPGIDCAFGQFCSKSMTVKITRQLSPHQSKLYFQEFQFLKELDCFRGTQEEISEGFKERVYRIQKWMDDYTPRTIEFEL